MPALVSEKIANQLFRRIQRMPNFVHFYTWPEEEHFYNVRISIAEAKYQDVVEKFEWVMKNVKHKFSISGGLDWYFVDINEAAFFKLHWGG